MACTNPNHDRVVMLRRTFRENGRRRQETVEIALHGAPSASDLAEELSYDGMLDGYLSVSSGETKVAYTAVRERREDGLPCDDNEDINVLFEES